APPSAPPNLSVTEPVTAAPSAKLETVLPSQGSKTAEIIPRVESTAPETAVALASQTKVRLPCHFERLARRTLSDPVRSQPLVQLADRLRRDAEQTASKTVAIVGVGPGSATHQPLFYAATLLAASAPHGMLLIDADLARRP